MVGFPLLCVGHETIPRAKGIAGLGRKTLFLSAKGTHHALAAVMELEASWFLFVGRCTEYVGGGHSKSELGGH